MKGLYIIWKDLHTKKLTGIDKKILAQQKIFDSNGLNCKFINLEYKKSLSLIEKICIRLPFSNINPKWKFDSVMPDVDYIYLRRPMFISNSMLKVLKRIKLTNGKVKILLEIPTYPYDRELTNNLFSWPLYIKDRFNRRKLYKYVDRIAVFTENTELFNIPTVRFTNGIDLDNLKVKTPLSIDTKTINLCIVSSFENWHGYDRIIKSLNMYYKNAGKLEFKLIIHFVGDGPKLKLYKRLVKKYNLNTNVVFYGRLFGESLDEIYNICDIAVDVFGMYRKNNNISCSLKSREYFAKGLPVISGCQIDLLENTKNFKYFLQFTNDKTLIDLNDVITFYKSIYTLESKEMVIGNIRMFANATAGMEQGMKSIIHYIKKDE
ncbi:glycosyltransferase [Mariniplasma anaerobium]|uniref:Glycosyl transferase n=1 Tax=Mariniplasma anaerobium TaxID=2735436 RepID=A0A7U9XWZ5_9MOLU|nr:glycosyltransferase [Mariniplasma anaerobium]BCR36092.1 glycosyl transferase [Mariniplasma anaerobium]